jgi:hypothetical protein
VDGSQVEAPPRNLKSGVTSPHRERSERQAEKKAKDDQIVALETDLAALKTQMEEMRVTVSRRWEGGVRMEEWGGT